MDVRNSLRVYYESVSKVTECLKNFGYEDICHEQSKQNIDLCSFSDIFYLFDRPFIKLKYLLGHNFRIDSIATVYDIPLWEIHFFHRGGLSVYHKMELLHDSKSFEDWLDLILKEPDDSVHKKNLIVEQVEKQFAISIKTDNVLYDPVSSSYILMEGIEKNLLRGLMPVHDVEEVKIAKYTSFDTLISILQSGKIRMNSIISMNDKSETDFLDEIRRNYKDDFEYNQYKFLLADKEFITSFTTRIDELDMWRLYGDNARVYA